MEQDSKARHFIATRRGRGTGENPAGRFEKSVCELSPGYWEERHAEEEDGIQETTETFLDPSRTIISTNDSPDVCMEATLNPYRGCEHGCIYCYARPTHEYLGLSAGLDFETKIYVKDRAPELLAAKLSSKSWEPKVITLSGVTDCYQPLERKLEITRGCLKVLRDFRNPAVIITKNALVARDIDILEEMAAFDCISVMLSVTTLDGKLSRIMEPRASQPALRLRAMETLASKEIPVGVMIGPVLPGLTDHEIPAILKSCADAGAMNAHYTMLRLPYGVKDLFSTWLEQHYPDKAKKVLAHVRDVRGGKLNDPNFGSRMRGEGVYADHVANIFQLYKKKYGLTKRRPLTTKHFRRDARDQQMSLF
jgi:DNA repair photolyase